jgi:hypothetical protein
MCRQQSRPQLRSLDEGVVEPQSCSNDCTSTRESTVPPACNLGHQRGRCRSMTSTLVEVPQNRQPVGRSSRLRLAHGSGVQQWQHHLVDDLNDHPIGDAAAMGQKVEPHHR